VIDARSGRVVRALDPSTGPVRDPMIAIGGLRERLLGSIVSADAARGVALGSAPPKYSAYVEYLEGMRTFVKDQRGSRQFFARAIELDSTLVPAYVQLAATYTNTGQFDEAERVIASLKAQRTHLSSYDRLVLEFLDVHNRYVADQILPLAQEVYARGQNPLFSYLVGFWALRILRPDVARHALEISDSLMTSSGWVGQARDVAITHHQLGDFRGELAALERGSRVVPAGAPAYRNSRLRAYAGFHDSTSAIALADTLLRNAADPSALGAVNAVQLGAREFAGHGDSATATRLADMELAWLHAHAGAATTARDMATAVAWFDRGNLDSAEARLRQIKTDTGNAAVSRAGYLGVIAAKRGDTTRARAVADSLANQQRKWDLGLSAFWRAAIMAHLGRRDEALALLGEARRNGQSMADWHASRPLWPLRGYGPFEEMIRPKK
jgi:tetratricopeptide (TPR) repeat protein